MAYDLVIFDMDGTLIDSETVAERVLVEATATLSRPMTADEVTSVFRGRTVEYTLQYLSEREGGPLPDTFIADLNTRYVTALGSELQPTVGARETVLAVKARARACVASNSDPDGIGFCLGSAGLLDLFDASQLFSAASVANPKPAPDLFLHAAESMGAKPSRCLVVEDSDLGLDAARAAGMQAVGFYGNDRSRRDELAAFGVPVFDTFTDVIQHFEAG